MDLRGKKGNKKKAYLPSSYDMGIPAVNFFLAILNKAKEDDAQLWIDFQKTELYEVGMKGKIDALEIAWWVCEYGKRVKG